MIRSISSFKKHYVFFISILIIFSIIFNYVVAEVLFVFYQRFTDIIGYRVGYFPLSIGVVSLVVFLLDLFLFVYIFTVIILRRSLSYLLSKAFLKNFFATSILIIILLTPYYIAGVGGILAEKTFYEFAVITLYIWSIIIAVYGLIIHPIYSPYAGLATSYCSSNRDRSLKCVFRFMLKNYSLIPNIIATSIITWLITLMTALILIYLVPILNTPLISIPKPPPLGWSERWFNTITHLMPRYFKLITDPLQYIMYAYIFLLISRRKLERLLAGLATEHSS